METFERGGATDFAVGMRLRNHGPGEVKLAVGDFDTIFSRERGVNNGYMLTVIRSPVRTSATSPMPNVVLKPGECREFPDVFPGRRFRAIPDREFSLRICYDESDAALPADFFKGRVAADAKVYRRAGNGNRP